MKYESNILKRLIDTYGVVGNPRYISEIIKEFIVQGKERFPNLFTYQSDWLAHIDKFGLNPSYTVSYTGQSIYAPNTLERPVKSAILKGQTIKVYQDNLFDGIVESGGLSINTGENDDRYPSRCRSANFIKVEPNSIITFARNLSTKDFHVVGYNENKEFVKGFTNVMRTDDLVGKINTTSDIYYVRFYDIEPPSNPEYGVFQGDVEPTYELVSVKMPVLTTIGSNIFDSSKVKDLDSNWKEPFEPTTQLIRCNPNTKYYYNGKSFDYIILYDENKNTISSVQVWHKEGIKSFTTTSNCFFLGFQARKNSFDSINEHFISTNNYYEPYKSNILSTSEDVVLRGIGDVKDTLDCLTGEIVERIGVLNRSTIRELSIEKSSFAPTDPSIIAFAFNALRDDAKFLSPYLTYSTNKNLPNTWCRTTGVWCNIRLYKSEVSTIEGFKEWLDNHIVLFTKRQETVKTVDLNILDQNGQNIKQLMSFNGGTHFNTGSAEGSLLPVVSVSVDTDLEETLRVCSLEGNTM